jgi:hypothetical protein
MAFSNPARGKNVFSFTTAGLKCLSLERADEDEEDQ